MLLRAVLLCAFALPASAEPYASIQDRRPDLFHPETGYRIARQRAPTPEDIPAPAQLVDAAEARALIEAGALALDVYGASYSRFDELDGTWLVSEQRLSLPGALWLPETGRGTLNETMESYLRTNLAKATAGNRDHPLVVFCIADCWMSWNAAQRLSNLGYTQVYWYRLGTDGWRDEGWALVPIDPVPVTVD
ncbi:PQQ-dependent catabolism-associated CXXCW motif protein [Tropicimonas sp. S265A]|uniref:PQQ-dependent catabolism-associated CXXCW motif protein n=1 Tax=Tropicimonas sp. S265A TaxID=3415134 RepID=UPI003C7E22E2